MRVLLFILMLVNAIAGLVLVLAEMEDFELFTFIVVKIIGFTAIYIAMYIAKKTFNLC